jgi:hypothetical protein
MIDNMNRLKRRKWKLVRTYVKVDQIVENSFRIAIERSGLLASKEYISDMKGWPIWFALETLSNKLMPYAKEKEIQKKVEESFSIFRIRLETYCKLHHVHKNIRTFLLHPEKIRIYGSAI